MRHHYHVLCGLRGCFTPNSNNVHRTRRDAERDAAESARREREDGIYVRGSAWSGYYVVGAGSCIEITTCTDAACLESNDNE